MAKIDFSARTANKIRLKMFRAWRDIQSERIDEFLASCKCIPCYLRIFMLVHYIEFLEFLATSIPAKTKTRLQFELALS